MTFTQYKVVFCSHATDRFQYWSDTGSNWWIRMEIAKDYNKILWWGEVRLPINKCEITQICEWYLLYPVKMICAIQVRYFDNPPHTWFVQRTCALNVYCFWSDSIIFESNANCMQFIVGPQIVLYWSQAMNGFQATLPGISLYSSLLTCTRNLWPMNSHEKLW